MLSQVVNVSANNMITIATPTVTPTHKETIVRPSSVIELFSATIEAACFNQLSEVAYYHLHLAHYRNQLLHLFVEDAMMAVCLTSPQMDYGMCR